jgi:hypothetical protein
MDSGAVVLLAVPVTVEEFGVEPFSAGTSDYMRTMVGSDPIDVAWSARYQSVATAVQLMMAAALEAGASIVRKASARDLAKATERYREIIIVAHWKGAAIAACDIRSDTAELATALDRSRVASLRLLAAEIGDASPESCASVLNRFIDFEGIHEHEAEVPDLSIRESVDYLGIRAWRRELLNSELGRMLIPGCRLELADGLHSPEQVDKTIAKDFAGVLDFSSCDSSVSAQYVKDRRRSACTVIFDSNKLLPQARFRILATTFQVMKETRDCYLNSRVEVERLLVKSLGNRGN